MSNPTGKGGFQERKHQINRKGRPKSFDALRALGQQIAHEAAKDGSAPIVIEGHIITVAEAILRQWATSKNPQLQRAFIEICFGKVPDALDVTVGEVIKIVWSEARDSHAADARGAIGDTQ